MRALRQGPETVAAQEQVTLQDAVLLGVSTDSAVPGALLELTVVGAGADGVRFRSGGEVSNSLPIRVAEERAFPAS